MKRWLFVIFVLSATILNAKFIEYKSKILSIDGNTATVKSSPEVMIGSSGVVIHSYSKKHSTIVAKVIVTDKNSDYIKLRFRKFDDLKQDVLPVPMILPSTGDTVILNYLYNHAFAITPNYKTYKEITTKHKDISWLHPDLFAGELFTDSNPSPNRKDFQKFCKEYSFSLLYFAIENKGYFVDCNSFKALKTEKITSKKNPVTVPFYSRIKDIDASWLSFGKSKITNYDNYYKMLLRQ
jgi:hypothetical protein